jgi:hypothetical protein
MSCHIYYFQTKAKHHAVSSKLDRPFRFDGKPFQTYKNKAIFSVFMVSSKRYIKCILKDIFVPVPS